MRALLFFFLCSTPWTQLAAMPWEELRHAATRPERERSEGDQLLLQRLSEMVLMTVVYTRQLRDANPGAQLFCPPQGQPFHLQDLLTLISDQARNTQADPATPVQQLLLDGLRQQFPCPKSQASGPSLPFI